MLRGTAGTLRRMRRGSVVVSVILGCALVLTGCSIGPDRERVTQTDRQRLQVMLDEPIIRKSEQDISKQPGTLGIDGALQRGFVTASVFSVYPEEGRQPPPELTKRRTAEAIGVLRSSGWTIASATCTPPEPNDPVGARRWASTGYKHVDGVSYWVNLTGAVADNGLGLVDVALRAPNVDDPPDLIGHPAGLPAGSTCIEQAGLLNKPVEQGKPVTMEPVVPGGGDEAAR